MKTLTSIFVLTAALGLASSAVTHSAAGLDPAGQAQPRFRARVSDSQVRTILTRIRTNAEALVRTIDGVPPRGRAWGNQSRTANDAAFLVEDLLQASAHMDDHLTRAVLVRADVDDVLRRGALVDQAFTQTSQPAAAERSWTAIRRDLDSLASAYGLAWDWQNPGYSSDPTTGVYRELDGTYTRDQARSDNPQRTIDAALRALPVAERTRASRQLANRLDPPDVIAIDRTDGRIIIASSRGPQLTFDADGRPRTETGPGGQTITTRASVYGDQLDVTTIGVANNEFGVTFEPLTGGRDLRVTRRLYTDALRQPVTLQTIYRKTSDIPDWNLYDRPGTEPIATARPGRGAAGVVVPEGTTLVARLDQTVSLRETREDDRISLTVHNSPRPEFEGATIEGTILTSPLSADRSRVTLRFDRIRLRNGRYGDFDGVIERVAGPNGESIRFDGEVAAADPDRGDAIQRGAIGAAIGGLIGAIAGGGKGAVIGAAIGGSGAAATVLLDDPQRGELLRGTEFTIRSLAR